MSPSKDEKAVPPTAAVAGSTFGVRRSRWARIALVATAAVTYWAVRLHHGFYEDMLRIRTTYALCSHDPDGLYTVDVLNSVTQCMVVKDTFIADTGSLGGLFCSHDKIRALTTLVQQRLCVVGGRVSTLPLRPKAR